MRGLIDERPSRAVDTPDLFEFYKGGRKLQALLRVENCHSEFGFYIQSVAFSLLSKCFTLKCEQCFPQAVMGNVMVEHTGLSVKLWTTVLDGGGWGGGSAPAPQHKWLRGRSQQERTVSDLTVAFSIPHSSMLLWSPQSSCSRLI